MAERIRLKLKLGSSALTAGGSAALTAGGSAALTAGSSAALTAGGSAALTEGGPTIEVSRRQLKQFVFPTGPTKSKDLVRLTFRNTDTIFGRFADEKLTVNSKIGLVTVLCRDVAKAEFNAAAPGQAKLTIRDGTALAGKLADDYIKFKIEPGPVLKIFTGHIESITGAAMRSPGANTQSPAPSPTTHTGRITISEEPLSADKRANIKAEIDEWKNTLAKTRAERAKVEAEMKEIRAKDDDGKDARGLERQGRKGQENAVRGVGIFEKIRWPVGVTRYFGRSMAASRSSYNFSFPSPSHLRPLSDLSND
ncbi:MAG: hypothetical protein SVV80_12735, partial [Planctomycetota bacterium]|nr:hypothetical protein [Planctomycetota bacterium]